MREMENERNAISQSCSIYRTSHCHVPQARLRFPHAASRFALIGSLQPHFLFPQNTDSFFFVASPRLNILFP
jgi:hypothetical protein